MEPITLILTALTAGAASAAKDTASKAVKDTYEGLVKLVKNKLAGKENAELVLAEYKQKPKVWEAPLKHQLIETGTDEDIEIIEVAKKLMELVEPEGNHTIKYNTTIGDNAKGFAIGDQAQINNNWNDNSSEE